MNSFKTLLFPTQCILISSIAQYSPAHYGDYTYPLWAEFLGWCISLASIVWIPLAAIHELYKIKGSLLQVSTRPIILRETVKVILHWVLQLPNLYIFLH